MSRRGIPGRIVGLDYARFLALAGMMATHLWNLSIDGEPPVLSGVLQGKAAALFAVLAGVGIALSTRGLLAAGRSGSARWSVFGRGLMLVVIGLTLGLLPGGILVILVYYGLTFWAMIPLLRVPSRWLLVIAAVWAVLWPFVLVWARSGLVVPYEVGSASWLDFADPLALARGLIATGVYPVGTWVVYTMVGMVIGRAVLEASDQVRDLALRNLGLRIAALGGGVAALAAVLSWVLAVPLGGLSALAAAHPDLGADGVRQLFYAEQYGGPPTGDLRWLASPAPHTGTTFDLLITCGTSALAIGLCLALGEMIGRVGRTILSPVSGAGAAPLTVYTLHVIVAGFTDLAAAPPWNDGVPWQISSAGIWLLHVAGALMLGLVLTLLGRRGPLEALVSSVAKRFARLGRA